MIYEFYHEYVYEGNKYTLNVKRVSGDTSKDYWRYCLVKDSQIFYEGLISSPKDQMPIKMTVCKDLLANLAGIVLGLMDSVGKEPPKVGAY